MTVSSILRGLRLPHRLFSGAFSWTCRHRGETEAEGLVTESRLTVDRLMADKDFFAAGEVHQERQGHLHRPATGERQLHHRRRGGSGVFLARGTDGSWSPPTFYTLAAGSLGLQIGGEVKEVVFVLMSDKAVDAMLSSEFKGADASITVGPMGRGVEALTEAGATTDIYA